MRIFISAGEPSGDLHAANLIHSLRRNVPDAVFLGYGGPRMAEAGATVLFPLVDLAVMWFLNVFLNIATFIRLVFQADRLFRDDKPDAVVLIDYPGLHWWIASRAKARGIPVIYFVPPQIWAWGGWRVGKVKKSIDQVLCSLPFEPAWYHARGVSQAHYVGHPYFDELAERMLDQEFLNAQTQKQGRLVAILPGSRTQELKRNLPDMIRAAIELAASRSDVRFAVACLHDRHRLMAEEIVAQYQASENPSARAEIEIHTAKTPELIRLARVAWAVSGSVGLELMADNVPSVVLYKVNRFDLWVARHFIRSKFISLVNLLADDEVFPEFLTWRDASHDLARYARAWLDETDARTRAVAAIDALRRKVANPGASDRAADRIVEYLKHRGDPKAGASEPSRQAYRGPHEIRALGEPTPRAEDHAH
jgi:lipid-A-disaccharide synthase